jgi:hypothetical protein
LEKTARHQAALLEPKIEQNDPEKKIPSTAANAIRRSQKNHCQSNAKPTRLFLHAWNRFNRSQHPIFRLGLECSINQQRIGFGVDIFHRNLKAIKTLSFGILNFTQKINGQVFVDNPSDAAKKPIRGI